ncbi:MAG: hypothetical protein R3F61_03170 [Myxococcota bacterium]
MRNLLLGGIAVLAGCGISEDKFAEDWVETYCAAYDECDTSGRPCPVNIENQTPAASCEFDKKAAKDCLSADLTCDDTIAGFEVVEAPESCYIVCGQDSTTEASGE